MYFLAGGPYPRDFGSLYMAEYRERAEIRRTSNRVCWTALAGILLMGFFLPSMGEIFLRTIGFSFDGNQDFSGFPPVLYYLFLGLNYVLGLAIPAFLYFSAQHIPLSEGLPFRKTSALNLVLYVFFGSMVCMLANYPADLVSKLQEYFGFSGDLAPMPLNNDPAVLALYGLSVVIIPPLVEEIMFRGVILQSLRRYGNGFAVLVSAMLFGMYHGNLIQMVFAFLSGLALGYVVIRTNSLLPSILIHFINNGVSYAIEMISRFYGQSMANYIDSIVSLFLVVLGIFAMIVLFAQHKLFSRKRSASVLPFSSRLGAAFGNVGAVFFIFYAVAKSIETLYYGG